MKITEVTKIIVEQNVEPRPTGSGRNVRGSQMAWDRRFRATHNPDGTPKATTQPATNTGTTAREIWNQIRDRRNQLPQGPERVRLSNLMNQINVNSTSPERAAAILAQANLTPPAAPTPAAPAPAAPRGAAVAGTQPPAASSAPTTNQDGTVQGPGQAARPGARPAPTPAAAPTPAEAPSAPTPAAADNFTLTQTLRRGSRGDEVRRLQAALGLPANEQDGIFGPRTEQAVRTFQQNQGIQADGIVGRQTLAQIQRSRENPNAPRNVTPGQIQNQSKEHNGNPLSEGVRIAKLAGVNMKKQLNEASITINGGAEEIAELMRMMQLAGANGAKPVDTAMINQPDSHMGSCGCSSCAAKQGPREPDMGDMIRMISSEEEDLDGGFEDATTEPAEYTSSNAGDVSDIIPAGNDLHKEKGSYPATAGGDNPMRIKEQLMKALAEKKAKPDFLDVDKDGDKKEPMKKALKDKDKKVDEYAKKKKKKYNEAEVQAPNHEISDTARQATKIAQMIKKKINSGDQMDDRDYNQMAELGTILSRLGTSFGPKTMKDVLNHMIEYTDDRNQEGHNYPEFNVDRFKELIAMAKE